MLDKAVIDLSHWDEWPMDFNKAKADGVVGVIHKVTEGSSYVDPAYDKTKKAVKAAGLLWGAYHFLRPGNMKQQAQWMIAKIGEQIDLYAADHEDAGVSLSNLKEFLAEVQRLSGRTPVIYSGHVIKEQVGSKPDSVLAQYPLWIAHYTSASQPTWPKQIWPKWWLWQYTEKGKVAGIPGDSSGGLDVNRYDGTAEQLRDDWTGGEPGPAPEPPPAEVAVTIIAHSRTGNQRGNAKLRQAARQGACLPSGQINRRCEVKKILLALLALALVLPATDTLAKKRTQVRVHKPAPCATPGCDQWSKGDVPLIAVPPIAVAFDLARRMSCDPAIDRPYGIADPGYPGGAQVGNFLIPAIYRAECLRR